MKVAQSFGAGSGLLALMLAGVGSAGAQAVSAVPQLDLRKFTGAWYEIALLPNKQEKSCVGDALRLYALADKPGRFQTVESCKVKKGYPNIRNENGRVHSKKGDGTLEVRHLLLFHRKTWVLALGGDDDWALVGSPDHKQLWLLSRKPQPDAQLVEDMKAKAAAEGFDVGKLVFMPQSSR